MGERRKEVQRTVVAETWLFAGNKLQRKSAEGDRGQHLSASERREDPEWERALQTMI